MLSKKIYILSLFVTLLLSFCQNIWGQDLHFSQFYETALLRNPSFAGLYNGDYRIQTIYRNQWNSLATPFQTSAINADIKLPVGKGDDFMTLGLQIITDKAGSVALTTNHLLPAVNYHKSLSGNRNTYLSLGFMGGLVSRRLDFSRMTTNSQYDGFNYNGSLPSGEFFNTNYSFLDMNVGISLLTTMGENDQHSIFGGIAYHHFNKPINSFYKKINHLPKLVLSGGLKLNADRVNYITFHGDYSLQGQYKMANVGAILSHKLGDGDDLGNVFHVGAMYRYNDAFVPVIKLDLRPISFSLSYDVNISPLITASQGTGGIEFGLSYINFLPTAITSRDKVRCPKF
jgi:type IX secretion system PorP/SprF family membrane protein